jgi:cob(I)alamin adenosyltransferase
MKIYTKTGDQGQTSLLGGQRVGKDSSRIELIGTLDELNSVVGLALAFGAQPVEAALIRTQRQLFALGAELARSEPGASAFCDRLADWTAELEREIDRFTEGLPPLANFILPGGAAAAAAVHLARAVCRRLERVFFSQPFVQGQAIGAYLNRLGDWLFVVARSINQSQGKTETIWNGGHD